MERIKSLYYAGGFMKIQESTVNLTTQSLIEWNSIIVGIIVTLFVGLLFNLLGLAIGFSLFSPTVSGLQTLTAGTIAWLIMSGLISMYSGGWVASRFGNGKTFQRGALYGGIVGAISTFILLTIAATTIGALVTNSFAALQHSISIASSAVNEAPSIVDKAVKGVARMAPQLNDKVKKVIPDLQPVINKINEKALQLLPEVGEKDQSGNMPSPEKIKAQLEKEVSSYIDSLDEVNSSEEAKEKLIQALIKVTGKTPEEVNQAIEEWNKLYSEAKDKLYKSTVSTSREVARTMSYFALINFLIITSSIVAALFGGIHGVNNKPRISFQEA